MLLFKFPELTFAWDLHDGLFYWVPKTKEGLAACREAREVLNNLDYEGAWGWKPRIPIPWDLSIGTNWAEIRRFEMKNEESNILQWAEDRGFFSEDGPIPLKQHDVLVEEVLELRDEILKATTIAKTGIPGIQGMVCRRSAKVELGDCGVVLIIMARLMGTSLEECLELAYDKIKDREGEWRDGKWTKESDLQ